MLRAVTSIYIESKSLARRDIFKVFRVCCYSSSPTGEETVLSHSSKKKDLEEKESFEKKIVFNDSNAVNNSSPSQTPPPPPPQSPRTWSALAAIALTASLGGVYCYRKLNDDARVNLIQKTASDHKKEELTAEKDGPRPSPATAVELPSHVQYLLVGGGTASFAAMRAIRSLRPDAQVLIVAAEQALPYMRPPLSKELWRERDLEPLAAALDAADAPAALAFSQWNGRRRRLVYEPAAFYTPPARLRDAAPGAGLARGWRVTRIDPAAHTAELAAGGEARTLTYDKCLLATGVRPRRVPALRPAAAAGRSLVLRGVRDAQRLAAVLEQPGVRTVAVVGGGFLGCELAAALAERLRGENKRVVQMFREAAPLARVLPPYLAEEAARRLAEAGVELRPGTEVVDGEVEAAGRVRLALADGERLAVDVVVECAGSEPATEAAEAAGLELHEALGGVVVNAELQARADLYVAGDVACFYDVALGRRRVEHHDHAVVSGRLAGENMAAVAPPKHYTHQSMFWSDLGPQLGYEAIGIIDSRLPTVGVFSADAVGGEAAAVDAVVSGRAVAAGGALDAAGAAVGAAGAAVGAAGAAVGAAGAAEAPKRYERGVVFYLREERVVGVLLWNLFNRMQVARQVLAQGKFDDLFEVAKHFSPHEED